MIRKLILVFFLISLALPLFASLSFFPEISESDKTLLTRFFEDAVAGRKDVGMEITSFVKEDGYMRLSFSIEGERREISASDYDELEEFIANALSLESLLYLDGSTLFYVSDNIIASEDEYRTGSYVEAYDRDGRKRALLEVTDNEGGINLYSAVYKKDLKAGLLLKKGPLFSLNVRALSDIYFNNFAFAADLLYLPLFKYFNPSLSLYAASKGGSFSYYGGLGGEVRLALERLIRSGFTLIEDASIIASATIYLGYDNGFSWGSGFSVAYEHHISSRYYWRLGYETSTIVQNGIMLSFGVLI